jgi:hypothetical protein
MNVIADNMHAQVENKGNMFHFFLKIMDHKKDGMVINILDGKITLANGNTKPKITTKGLMLLVIWKDGSTSWVKLKDLKASNPGCGICRVYSGRTILSQAKVKKNYWKVMQKFGIKLPHSTEEALEINRVMGMDHWRKAFNKEMLTVKIVWNAKDGIALEAVRSGKAKGMIGFQEIGCHIVFDIKMDIMRKARFVDSGHMLETPAALMYSSVVLRESI